MLKISKFNLSLNSKPLIIAEVGQSHRGKIKNIERIINLISKTGADFIKFQTHYGEDESTLDEPFRVKISNYKSRIDYWKSVEFNINEWKKIKNICDKKKIIFLSSPFSIKAVKILHKIGMPAWKIGSGEFFSDDLLENVFKYKKPIILSTGLATMDEIKDKIKMIKRKKVKFILMQCTSLYPCSISQVKPDIIKIFKKKFNCLTGLSDHSGSIYPSIYALSNGASLIEVHVEEKTDKLNPDSTSSISIKDLEELCKARDQIYNMKISKKHKKLTPQLLKNKKIFTKSCALINDKKKGYFIKKEDIVFKKPGFGINAKYIKEIIGKKLVKDVSHNRILRKNDFK
jgi:N,N'-diacetyllegionaminate synthase